MDEKFEWITIDDPEEAERLIAEFNKKTKRNGEVCICGHTMKAHQSMPNDPTNVICQPAKIQCMCAKPRAVITSSDLRLFLNQTEGSAGLHALGKGIIRAGKRDAKIEWIQDRSCDDCGATDNVSPVPINTRTQKPTVESTAIDLLLCRECYVRRASANV